MEREDPKTVYVAIKSKIMTAYAKEWGLEDATRLLQRFIESLDEDLMVVKDYVDKIKRKLEAKIGDPEFSRLQGFFILSMCLSKPHQVVFDQLMTTMRDTRPIAAMMEPFDRILKAKMTAIQKKFLTGDSRQLPLGDLGKNELRKCGLIATQKIRPEEPKPKFKPTEKKAKVTADKPKKNNKKKTEKTAKETKAVKSEATSKVNVENQPAPKKAKKTKVDSPDYENVIDTLQELKVLLSVHNIFVNIDRSSFFNYFLRTGDSQLKFILVIMVAKDIIRSHFATVPKSVANIIAFCQEEYEELARRKGDLFVTNYLDVLVAQVCKALQLSNSFRQKVSRGLYHITLAYRVRSGMESNKAPIFHPKQHLKLIRSLWFKKKPSVSLTFALRVTAMQALLCLHSYRRWIDVSRIRWEHCTTVKSKNRTFVKFKLSASKTNVKGRRNEYITIQENNTDMCPVKILYQFWAMQGAPKTGFVLPCLHENRTYNHNTLCEQWDAYTCMGHSKSKSKSGKLPCLGEVNGTTSFGYYKRAAKDTGWKTLPHKHSFRRAGVVLAKKLDVPRERITEFFGWKHDSCMVSHYLQEELATTSKGLAWQAADALQSNWECLQDVSFAT